MPKKEYICWFCNNKFNRDDCHINRFCSKKCLYASYKKSKLMSGNPMWKGDKVGYFALHNWIKEHKKKINYCEDCKQKKPLDLCNISQKYKRDINDFEWLCRRCHMKKDGRLKQFILNIRRGSPKGENANNWKGGKPKCLCGIEINYKNKTRKCKKCYDKSRIKDIEEKRKINREYARQWRSRHQIIKKCIMCKLTEIIGRKRICADCNFDKKYARNNRKRK